MKRKIKILVGILCMVFGMTGCSGQSVANEPKEKEESEEMKRAVQAMDKYLEQCYKVEEDGTGKIIGEQFWPRAEIMEIVIDAYEKTEDSQYLDLMRQMYDGFVQDYGEEWSSNEYNDDIMWMTIACIRAYQAGGDDLYLQQAVHHFNLVYDRAWSDDLGGGLFWRTDNGTKNSCINGPAVIAACLLYQSTQEQDYLNKALEIYNWQCDNLFGPDGAVYDAYDLKSGINEWCSTYNQGTFIGASVYLYQELKDESYLQNAIQAADYTMNIMFSGGVMNTEETGGDLPGFKGILARWLGKLVYECDQEQYLPWMEKNAQSAWENRNINDIMCTQWAEKTEDTLIFVRYSSWGCSAAVSLMWNCLPPADMKE